MILGGTKTVKASFHIKFEKGLGYTQSSKSHDTSLCNGYVFRNESNYILSFLKRRRFCSILRIHSFIESILVQKYVQFIVHYTARKQGVFKGKG